MSITEDDLKKLTFIQLVRKLSIGAWFWIFAIIGTLCFASYRLSSFIESSGNHNSINIIEKRHTEVLFIYLENGKSYVSLSKEPIADSIQIFWDNLYIQPEAYKIDKKSIIFDTEKESGLIEDQKVTVIYYNK